LDADMDEYIHAYALADADFYPHGHAKLDADSYFYGFAHLNLDEDMDTNGDTKRLSDFFG